MTSILFPQSASPDSATSANSPATNAGDGAGVAGNLGAAGLRQADGADAPADVPFEAHLAQAESAASSDDAESAADNTAAADSIDPQVGLLHFLETSQQSVVPADVHQLVEITAASDSLSEISQTLLSGWSSGSLLGRSVNQLSGASNQSLLLGSANSENSVATQFESLATNLGEQTGASGGRASHDSNHAAEVDRDFSRGATEPLLLTPAMAARQTSDVVHIRALPETMTTRVASWAGVSSRNNRTMFHMRLEPPELGTLQVHLMSTEQAVSIRMVAADEVARQIIATQVSELQKSLEELGLTVQQFDVTVGDGTSQADHDAAGTPVVFTSNSAATDGSPQAARRTSRNPSSFAIDVVG